MMFPTRPLFRLMGIGFTLAALSSVTVGCGPGREPAGSDAQAVHDRALDVQASPTDTGAVIQEQALNQVVQASYLCDNSERLSVDFDNPRQMATIRTSSGLAYDLHQQRSADGIWYRSADAELRGRGNQATWTAKGLVANCRAVD